MQKANGIGEGTSTIHVCLFKLQFSMTMASSSSGTLLLKGFLLLVKIFFFQGKPQNSGTKICPLSGYVTTQSQWKVLSHTNYTAKCVRAIGSATKNCSNVQKSMQFDWCQTLVETYVKVLPLVKASKATRFRKKKNLRLVPVYLHSVPAQQLQFEQGTVSWQ